MSEEAEARKLRARVSDDALIFTAGDAPALVRLGLFPLLWAFLGSNLTALAYSGAAVSQILNTLAGVIFAVGVHRMIIRDENPKWVFFRFGRAEVAYTGVVLLYILVASSAHYMGQALTALFGSAADTVSHGVRYKAPLTPALIIVVGPASIALIWALLRLLLVFPHAAVTGEIALDVSWNAMRGNIWRLLSPMTMFPSRAARVATFLVGVVVVFGGSLASHLPGQARVLAEAALAGPLIATAAAIASFAYKDLVAPRPDAAGAHDISAVDVR